jgi:hypothetical protein
LAAGMDTLLVHTSGHRWLAGDPGEITWTAGARVELGRHAECQGRRRMAASRGAR